MVQRGQAFSYAPRYDSDSRPTSQPTRAQRLLAVAVVVAVVVTVSWSQEVRSFWAATANKTAVDGANASVAGKWVVSTQSRGGFRSWRKGRRGGGGRHRRRAGGADSAVMTTGASRNAEGVRFPSLAGLCTIGAVRKSCCWLGRPRVGDFAMRADADTAASRCA